MSRVLIVSNRLPITVRADAASVAVERSSGGLATGLTSVHEQGGCLWIGWPGSRRASPSTSATRSRRPRAAARSASPGR